MRVAAWLGSCTTAIVLGAALCVAPAYAQLGDDIPVVCVPGSTGSTTGTGGTTGTGTGTGGTTDTGTGTGGTTDTGTGTGGTTDTGTGTGSTTDTGTGTGSTTGTGTGTGSTTGTGGTTGTGTGGTTGTGTGATTGTGTGATTGTGTGSTTGTGSGTGSTTSTGEEDDDTVTGPGTCVEDGVDFDCANFADQQSAQKYFLSQGGSTTNNVDNLDADGDGVACENLADDGDKKDEDVTSDGDDGSKASTSGDQVTDVPVGSAQTGGA